MPIRPACSVAISAGALVGHHCQSPFSAVKKSACCPVPAPISRTSARSGRTARSTASSGARLRSAAGEWGRVGFTAIVSGTKRARSAYAPGPVRVRNRRSVDADLVVEDVRRDEDQQFTLLVLGGAAAAQGSEHRQIAEHRHLGGVVVPLFLVD